VAPLVAAYKKDVQTLLNEGFHSKWEAGSKLEPYVRRLADAVATLRYARSPRGKKVLCANPH
jgi:hypothetical protein